MSERPSAGQLTELRRIVADDSDANYVWSIWCSGMRKLFAELDAVTLERNDLSQRLTRTREIVNDGLLHIDTFARNVAEYPNRIPLLIDAIERLAARLGGAA